MAYLSGAYFDVFLIGVPALLTGEFMHVEGLGMELDYDVFNEGGANYPRYFFKNSKPMYLTLSQGVVTSADGASILMTMVNLGMDIPLAGTIILHDSFGAPQRVWNVAGARIVKYVGPSLDSNKSAVAVNQIVLVHNGCY